MQCVGRRRRQASCSTTTRMRVLVLLIFISSFLTPAVSSAQQGQPKQRPGQRDALALQVALDRAGFSPGEIDGKVGTNTERALRAFQQAQGLTPTGELDSVTVARLGNVFTNPLSTYAISAADIAGPFTKAIPADMMEKASLPALGYTSVREMLAERFHMSPALVARLNPNARFAQGEVITVANVEPYVGSAGSAGGAVSAAGAGGAGRNDAAKARTTRSDVVVIVTDKTKTLTVQDGSGNVVFHAPVTVGSTNDPLPVGEWKVNGVQRNPAFNYNPGLFWDADPAHSKAKLAPGPNNPVGSVWIDLSKEHYGIHGTPEPSRIGYTESHGCIRLTNWDAVRLAALVAPGTKVVLR
jgi:lipoprotein-anchoring transpeptidase ErfK/SrfK